MLNDAASHRPRPRAARAPVGAPRLALESLLRTFAEVARWASFSQAARVLGLSRAAVSAQVAQLEQRLGVALLKRTTRSVSLTPEGERLLNQAHTVLDQLDTLANAFVQLRGEVAGALKVEAPEFVGTRLIVEPLVAWLKAHPQISLNLRLNDRVDEFVGQDADIHLRFELPTEHRLRYRPLGTFRLMTVAAPAYLRQHGTPRTLADLAHHRVIDYLNSRTGKPFEWEFEAVAVGGRLRNADIRRVTPPSALCCNHTDAALTAVRGGLGLYRDFGFVLQPLLDRGEAVEVLPLFTSPPYTLYALWRPAQPVAPRVAAFVEFLSECVQAALPPTAASATATATTISAARARPKA
jgi:LysR family transcriptional regulator, regulator for bpeEF and oprC